MKLFLFVGFLLTMLSTPLIPSPVYAAGNVDVFSEVCKNNANKSAVCKETKSTENPLFGPNGVITYAIKFMSVLVGVAAVIILILAGLKFITSGSNPQDVSKAREMIIYAIAGIIIALTAQIIVNFFLNRIGA